MTMSRATILALVGAFVLQVMIAPHLAIFGIVPSFPLLVVITLSFFQDSTKSASCWLFAGLLLDLLGTGPVGAWALVFTVCAYVGGLLRENIFAEGWLAPATIAVITALVADALYLIILTVLGVGPAFWASLLKVVLPRAVYNAVLLIIVYPWLGRFLHSGRLMKSFDRIV